METRGNNPKKKVIAIIPARYSSVRLKGKMLLEIAGKPLILHTLECVKKARNISSVMVATDDERILRAVRDSGNECVLTSPKHPSGSDRIAEVAEGLPNGTLIVNVQGDEPLIASDSIEKAIDAALNDESVDISTLCEVVKDSKDIFDPNVVKVVCDAKGNALYFSRLPIPFPASETRKYSRQTDAVSENPELLSHYRKHIGLYVYRREYLLKFAAMNPTPLEESEKLEQLRALENGAKIKVTEVVDGGIGVDTPEDFARVKSIIEGSKLAV